MAFSSEAESSLNQNSHTLEEERHLMFDVPHDLSVNHPVENALGTWHMDTAGQLIVFEAGVHSNPEPEKPIIPHVKDINAYASDILEKDLEKLDRNRQIEHEVHERLSRIPDLHVRSGLRKAAAIATRR